MPDAVAAAKIAIWVTGALLLLVILPAVVIWRFVERLLDRHEAADYPQPVPDDEQYWPEPESNGEDAR